MTEESRIQITEGRFQVIWQEAPDREGLREHRVEIEPDDLQKDYFWVLLNGRRVGRLRSGKADPFDYTSHQGAWYIEGGGTHDRHVSALEAAETLALRKLSGAPPPGQSDLTRWWKWEDDLGIRLLHLDDWFKVRGPYSPDHPYDEPLSDDFPPREIPEGIEYVRIERREIVKPDPEAPSEKFYQYILKKDEKKGRKKT